MDSIPGECEALGLVVFSNIIYLLIYFIHYNDVILTAFRIILTTWLYNNNVSSYSLPCCMNDVPVSFLVDTGAGVSLLQGTVWDKIKLQNHKLKTVTVH